MAIWIVGWYSREMRRRSRIPGMALVAIVAVVAVPTIAVATTSPHVVTSAPEVGVSVFFDDQALGGDQSTLASAAKLFSYLQNDLDANAVSIDFPFYMGTATQVVGNQSVVNAGVLEAQQSSTIVAGLGTPSVQLLGGLVRLAEKDGLRVQLRPLRSQLNDDTTGVPFDNKIAGTGEWRGSINPTSPSTWFANYFQWLKPYLVMAKETGVSSFSIGAELTSMVSATPINNTFFPSNNMPAHNYLPYWQRLVQEAQAIFGPNLLYSASHLTYQTIPGIQVGYDAYVPVDPPANLNATYPQTQTAASAAIQAAGAKGDNATVISDFQAAINASFQANNSAGANFPSNLSSLRLEEVGIPDMAYAWTQPYYYAYSSAAIATYNESWVQPDWITAECNVMQSNHMSGMYIWGIDFNNFSPTNTTPSVNPYTFQNSDTVAAIHACFSKVRSGS